MRVAFLALHFAEYSAHLAAALAESNDVLLILYADNARNELGERLQVEFARARLSIVTLDRPKAITDVVRNTRRIVRAVKEFSPEVVHTQEELRDELVFAMPMLRRYPWLMTVHDPTNHSGQDARRLRFSRYRVYRALVRRRVDAMFAHGTSLVAQLQRMQPKLVGRIYSIPHGPLGPPHEILLTEPLQLGHFLFFGRIHEYKGLRYFVEAVQRLHEQGLPVVGVIAGRGSDLQANLPQLQQTPGAFVVMDRYISEPDVQRLFAEATAVVLPYVDGTQSGVAALALGYGRPVIASRVGSIPELVHNGVNGVLIEPRDVDQLAEAMKSLLVDRERWRSMAAAALSLRSGSLSWRQIAATTEQAYRAALTRHSTVA
ncbi:glycosyltransferase family 4 protein [Paucibacter sp. R3-3]|uniref:Glycosyltransferase family 4 protein n=1 Tax=Roseateles agri TaxID=3098619 RepID=A0ABU5DC61_9BURK|nr:glycosyltransferase family 4 protein [Paucibacter sp. R3-3]MDY0743857.1 glycosyltransferase family 4 protein [Paucibacter sp. R3-3]